MPYKEGDQWRAKLTVDGKRYTCLKPTKKEAVEWEVQTKKELKNQEKKLLNEPKGMALFEFSGKYLEFCEDHFTHKVFLEKKYVLKRIIQTWGSETNVETITTEMAEKYMSDQKKARSAYAANKDRKHLLAMWNKGESTYGVKSNPFKGTKNFPHDRQPQYVPQPDDVLKVLMAAGGQDRVMLDTVLGTAARRSSVFRMLWDDVNFEHGKIRIGTKKTHDGSSKYHWLDMSDDLHESLKWWWENRTFKDSPFVFMDDQPGPHYGKPYAERRRFMAGLCDRAGVTPFGFHAIRRFVASMFADTHKVSMKKIQYLLGHASVSTTERYVYNIDKDLRGMMNLPMFGDSKDAKLKKVGG